MLLEIVNLYGVEILGTLLVALAGIFAMGMKQLAARYLDTETKRTLARTTVQFVEQTCKELHGETKLAAAMEALSALLAEKKIHATEQELRLLLEAAVGEFNHVFAEKKT